MRRAPVLLCLVALLAANARPAAATSEQFQIAIGDTVSADVPALGAGSLEAPGAVDVYTFEGQAGQSAIFDHLTGANVDIGWSLQAPTGTVLFDTFLQDRQTLLPETGTYTLTVAGHSPDDFGLYSFRLLAVPAAEQFALAFGDTVSEDVPAPGAGHLEVPGALDHYTFAGQAGQTAIFDHLSGINVFIGWTLRAPSGIVLFDTFLGDREPLLPETGTYTLTLRGNGIDDVGLYSFRLLEAPALEQFALAFGDTVSDGVPAPGAGRLETPGAQDAYTFAGLAGQTAIFDWLAGSNSALGWQLAAPAGTLLFNTVLQDHQVVLPATGAYTLTVRANGVDDIGAYSFQLRAVAAAQHFAIALGDTVAVDMPAAGAGHLEAPGAQDVYTWLGTSGQTVVFDWLSGSNAQLGWRLEAPPSGLLFDTTLQDHAVLLAVTGTYTLTVSGNGVDDFGEYSFALFEQTRLYVPLALR